MSIKSNDDFTQGRLCGLLAAGLRMEGLLRVAIERSEVRDDIAPQIRDAFEIYCNIFRQAWDCGHVPDSAPVVQETPPASFVPESFVEVEKQIEVTPAPEVLVEAAPEELPDVVSAEPKHVIEIEVEVETEQEVVVEAEAQPAIDVRPLSESLKVDELIARKESADLRRAFTLNDKFRFRRTLFGGSDARFSEVLDTLEAMNGYAEAEQYLSRVIDMEGEDAEDFMNIINAHFGGRL